MSPPVSDFIATEARFGVHNYEPLGVILSRGEGVWVWDTQGNRYLDCLSAYSAVNQGHCVRGRGLMLAVELHPEGGDARRYCEALQGRGILAKDTHGHTIRIAPPLVITSDQVDWALEGIGATFRQS